MAWGAQGRACLLAVELSALREAWVCAKCVLRVVCVYMTCYAGEDVRTCLCPSMLVCVSVCVFTHVCHGVCVHTHLCAMECVCLGVCVHVHVCAVRGQAYCNLPGFPSLRLVTNNDEFYVHFLSNSAINSCPHSHLEEQVTTRFTSQSSGVLRSSGPCPPGSALLITGSPEVPPRLPLSLWAVALPESFPGLPNKRNEEGL